MLIEKIFHFYQPLRLSLHYLQWHDCCEGVLGHGRLLSCIIAVAISGAFLDCLISAGAGVDWWFFCLCQHHHWMLHSLWWLQLSQWCSEFVEFFITIEELQQISAPASCKKLLQCDPMKVHWQKQLQLHWYEEMLYLQVLEGKIFLGGWIHQDGSPYYFATC